MKTLKQFIKSKDGMPWPQQPNDLQSGNFKIPEMLGKFLTTLITGKDCDNQMSSRQARLKHSITQENLYNVSNGKVKTPKSPLLPSNIKKLANDTHGDY